MNNIHNPFCEKSDGRESIYGEINEIYQNNRGSQLVKLLSEFHISDLRDFLYTSCSEQYAYSLIEKIQVYKLS